MALAAEKFIKTSGTPSGGEQAMQSTGVGPVEVNRKAEFGGCTINDDGSAYAYSAATEEVIQNAADGYTDFSQLPHGMTSGVWDEVNDWMDLSELSAGDLVMYRISLEINPTTAGQTMELRVVGQVGESAEWWDEVWRHYEDGSDAFSIHISGLFPASSQYGLDFPVQFRLVSDGAGTINTRSMHFNFFKRVSAY